MPVPTMSFQPQLASLVLAAVLGLALSSLSARPAAAQQQPSSDCDKLGAQLQARASLVQQAQKMSKKTTPDAACAVYTKLAANGNAVIASLEQNGTWCHVPDNILPAIKSQHAQVSKVRTQACGVAAQVRKMQKQARQARPEQAPWGGTGDVLGGPLRVPQGAL
jgi:hypothetical protein